MDLPTPDSEALRIQSLYARLVKAGFRLEDLLQAPYEAILVHSAAMIVTGNRAAADIIGCRMEELPGLNAWTLYPMESIPIVMKKLTSHTTEPYRVQARRRNGELFTVEIKGLEFDFRGEPLRAVMLREVDDELSA